MVDYDKVGRFLKKLRKDKHMSQQQLANRLYVTRQAISLWELGKCFPDIDTICNLAKYFDITVADIYAGEIIVDKQESNNIIRLILKAQISKTKKVMLVSVIIIFLLIGSFLTYYFVNTYKKTEIFMLSSDNDNYQVKGIITKSINNIYVNMEINKEVDRLCLTYEKDDIKNNIICEEDSNFIVTNGKLGYNEGITNLENINFNDLINNLYVIVNNNNDDELIKIDISKDYENNDLLFTKDDDIDEKSIFENLKIDVPDKIKNSFKYDKNRNYYYLNINNKKTIVEIRYILNNNIFSIQETHSNNIIEVWNYDNYKKILVQYSKYDKKEDKILKVIDDFLDVNLNEDKASIYNYFVDNYLNKYIN